MFCCYDFLDIITAAIIGWLWLPTCKRMIQYHQRLVGWGIGVNEQGQAITDGNNIYGIVQCLDISGRSADSVAQGSSSLVPTVSWREWKWMECFGYSERTLNLVVAVPPFLIILEPLISLAKSQGGRGESVNSGTDQLQNNNFPSSACGERHAKQSRANRPTNKPTSPATSESE